MLEGALIPTFLLKGGTCHLGTLGLWAAHPHTAAGWSGPFCDQGWDEGATHHPGCMSPPCHQRPAAEPGTRGGAGDEDASPAAGLAPAGRCFVRTPGPLRRRDKPKNSPSVPNIPSASSRRPRRRSSPLVSFPQQRAGERFLFSPRPRGGGGGLGGAGRKGRTMGTGRDGQLPIARDGGSSVARDGAGRAGEGGWQVAAAGTWVLGSAEIADGVSFLS